MSWLLLQVNIPKHVLHREEPVRAQVVLGSRTRPTLLELLAEAMHTILGCLLADVLCPICPVMAQHMDKCHPEYSIEKFTAINFCASTRYYWSNDNDYPNACPVSSSGCGLARTFSQDGAVAFAVSLLLSNTQSKVISAMLCYSYYSHSISFCYNDGRLMNEKHVYNKGSGSPDSPRLND